MRAALENKYEKYHQALFNEINNARMHLKIYQRLQEAKDGYLKELKQAPAFFVSTIQAHHDAGLMCVARILKEQSDSITIWKFLNFVEQNRILFQNKTKSSSYDVKADRTKLCEYQKVVDEIINWRDKKGAHIDEKFSLGKGKNSKTFDMKVEELFEVTEAISDVLNRYSYAYSSSRTKCDYCDDDGVAIVLDALKGKIQRRREWRQNLKKRAVS